MLKQKIIALGAVALSISPAFAAELNIGLSADVTTFDPHFVAAQPNLTAQKHVFDTLVYVDESDDKALDVALKRAARAYEGFLPQPKPGETFEERVREHAKKFIGRGEPGASEIMANLFDADYLMKHELVFIGSPKTVAEKLHKAAEAGLFNVFLGEFSFSDLPEADLMRSIRLFGEKVMPALRGFEPF